MTEDLAQARTQLATLENKQQHRPTAAVSYLARINLLKRDIHQLEIALDKRKRNLYSPHAFAITLSVIALVATILMFIAPPIGGAMFLGIVCASVAYRFGNNIHKAVFKQADATNDKPPLTSQSLKPILQGPSFNNELKDEPVILEASKETNKAYHQAAERQSLLKHTDTNSEVEPPSLRFK